MQQWDNDKLSMFLLDKWIKQDFRPGHCGLILICIFLQFLNVAWLWLRS